MTDLLAALAVALLMYLGDLAYVVARQLTDRSAAALQVRRFNRRQRRMNLASHWLLCEAWEVHRGQP